MINIFISTFLMIFSFTFFGITYKVCGINRAVVSTPMQLIETSINLISNDENPKLYFDKELLMVNLETYYDSSLLRYVDDYDVSYIFYETDKDHMCVGDLCRGVSVNIKVEINEFFHYEREMFYELRRN